jgi:hypothetical protein
MIAPFRDAAFVVAFVAVGSAGGAADAVFVDFAAVACDGAAGAVD